MMRLTLFLLLAALALPSLAEERVTLQRIDARLVEDGSLEVTERIEVHAEGKQFRHGIVRDLPLRYSDLDGAPVISVPEVKMVLRNGINEPWRARRVGDVLRITIGGPGYLPIPSDPVYIVHYSTTRQVTEGTDGDALSLDALAGNFGVPVEQVAVNLSLPEPVELDALRTESETGTADATGRDAHVALSARGNVRWTTSRTLQPGEDLRVRLTFPKGLVAPATRIQHAKWFVADHAGFLLACAGLLALTVYCVMRWRHVRRLPTDGGAPMRRDPPAGFSPAGLRYLRRMRYDVRCFAADLLAGAVDGHLGIVRQQQGNRTGWRLERRREVVVLPTMEQRAQLTTLLPSATDAIDLRGQESARITHALKAHETALRKRFQPALFRAHGGSILGALGIVATTTACALVLARYSTSWSLTVMVLLLMLPVLLVFALFVQAPTTEGRKALTQAEGLRRYMLGAARNTPKVEDAPAAAIDAARYVRLLPYAVALEVEDAWTRAFVASSGAAGALAAVASFDWYRGIAVTDLSRFSRSIGQSLTTRISAAAKPKKRKRRPAQESVAEGTTASDRTPDAPAGPEHSAEAATDVGSDAPTEARGQTATGTGARGDD